MNKNEKVSIKLTVQQANDLVMYLRDETPGDGLPWAVGIPLWEIMSQLRRKVPDNDSFLDNHRFVDRKVWET
jgi:uncharacterized protein (UPF0303 family)